MRLNKYLSDNSSLSRRSAEQAIKNGRVFINDKKAGLTDVVLEEDTIKLDGVIVKVQSQNPTILILNKPVGYVCSKDGQGSKTVYSIIPKEYTNFNIAGRLDKDSSGLVILTNSGELLNQLTHPSHQKSKVYEIIINKPLSKLDWQLIHVQGVVLEDGKSRLYLELTEPVDYRHWLVTLREGRNRQIRRTLAALGYNVSKLHRIKIAEYTLSDIKSGDYKKSNLNNNNN